MTTQTVSLRVRLLVLILVPLVIISLLAGYWRYTAARATSEELFDRTLVAVTMAIARDVAIAEGDLLSPVTRDLLNDASGGTLFYHVNGPDGVFVTGYGYPPASPPEVRAQVSYPVLFDSTYRSRSVRVARLTEYLTAAGISGFATVTVWQNKAGRDALARQMGTRAAFLICTLILTVAAVVWFGINLGLKPLKNLQDAISIRSSNDLNVIRRGVPMEVSGIVRTLNDLFGEVSRAMASRDAFISDAAHQLRNPVASILALATAARDAKTDQDRKKRTEELVDAARYASRLTQQLLSYERAKGLTDRQNFAKTAVGDLLRDVCAKNTKAIMDRGAELVFDDRSNGVSAELEPVLFSEAVQNLIDNALRHGGPSLSYVKIEVMAEAGQVLVSIENDGVGLNADELGLAFERFGQVRGGDGTGLGLPIVREIMHQHGGSVATRPQETGARFVLRLKTC